MVQRKQRQKRGYLCHRSHGRGNVKNRRGSGNRGGRGLAGVDKHKWSWAMNIGPTYFGKHGFVRPNKPDEIDTINLYHINQQALLSKLSKKDGKFHFEFKGKVLATGDVSVPLHIQAYSWSKSVERKLKESGGEIKKLEA